VSRRAIADTSVFVARETGRPLRPYEEDLEIAVLAAVETRTRAARLQTLRDVEQLAALPVDRAVASAFATLVMETRAAGLGRLGVQDAWIAATAIAHDAELLTQDADFDAVPGLRVIKL
jgi:predicted nucleic acid-binding protein